MKMLVGPNVSAVGPQPVRAAEIREESRIRSTVCNLRACAHHTPYLPSDALKRSQITGVLHGKSHGRQSLGFICI